MAKIQVGRGKGTGEAVSKRHAAVFLVNRVDRDDAADRILKQRKPSALVQGNPAGAAFMRLYDRTNQVESAIVSNREGRHSAQAGGIIKVVGKKKLVSVADIEAEWSYYTRSRYDRSSSVPIVANYVCVQVVGSFFSHHQNLSIGRESNLGGSGGSGAERLGGITDLGQPAIGACSEAGNVVCAANVAAAIEHIDQIAMHGHAQRLLPTGRYTVKQGERIVGDAKDRNVVTARVHYKHQPSVLTQLKRVSVAQCKIGFSAAGSSSTGGNRSHERKLVVSKLKG